MHGLLLYFLAALAAAAAVGAIAIGAVVVAALFVVVVGAILMGVVAVGAAVLVLSIILVAEARRRRRSKRSCAWVSDRPSCTGSRRDDFSHRVRRSMTNVVTASSRRPAAP